MNTFQKINLIIFILLLFPVLCVICTKCEMPNIEETVVSNEHNEQVEITVDESTYQIENVTEATETTNIKESETTINVTDKTTDDAESIDEVTEETTETIIEIVMYFTEKDVIALAKVLYNQRKLSPYHLEHLCIHCRELLLKQ